MKNNYRPLLIACCAIALATHFSSETIAASPQLSYVLPPGVQRGHEHVLTLTGARLADVEEALLYQTGVTVKKVEPVDAANVKITVDVAPDCRLGEQLIQLRTRSGVSDYRSFFVGALPSVDEKEPNTDEQNKDETDPWHSLELTISDVATTNARSDADVTAPTTSASRAARRSTCAPPLAPAAAGAARTSPRSRPAVRAGGLTGRRS